MKVKITNQKLKDFGSEYKIRKMNYDQIIVEYPQGDGFHTFESNDVELISEGEMDDFIISHKDVLKIKLPRGVSSFFYKGFIESVEQSISEKVKEIILLKDRFKEINKRGMWEKELLMVVNCYFPLNILVTGQSFKRNNYSFSVKSLSEQEFLDRCTHEINYITSQIKRREVLLTHYGMAIERVKKQGVSLSSKLLV
ncbi:hypothetical protein CPJCM30710_16090 [Clostridium polyendosporum]|uniref:Uncharacterized protein n=1 Tax=Clostridium polyendosporum TaxID=69208 RepID=A0A919S1L6_9CLOT|nr:hypothetical protein [Clostridium polyendosporum]GIM28943.1 hypothetical protein CPJCM30710_16090 [Clostridium polyendosporum]